MPYNSLPSWIRVLIARSCPPKGEEASFKIVAFYSIPDVTGALKVVPDNLTQRDVLEPNLVTGFVVFMPLAKNNSKNIDMFIQLATCFWN